MWILSFLPDFIFHLMVIIGVLALIAAYILDFIPFMLQYKIPIQAGGIILFVCGIFFEGAMSNEEAWQARVKELEVKVAQSEVRAAQENIKIVEKVVYVDKIIKERGKEVVKYIKTEVAKHDDKCEIPQEFVTAVNRAAEQPK